MAAVSTQTKKAFPARESLFGCGREVSSKTIGVDLPNTKRARNVFFDTVSSSFLTFSKKNKKVCKFLHKKIILKMKTKIKDKFWKEKEETFWDDRHRSCL